MSGKEKGKKDSSPGGGAPQGPTGPVLCGGQGCTKKQWRFGFCEDHHGQYKFGLINKKGEPVPDFDKKLEHYERYKQKRGAQKVA